MSSDGWRRDFDRVGQAAGARSRMGILDTHPAVFVRVANKGDKSRLRTGMKVRPEGRNSPHVRTFECRRKRGIERCRNVCGEKVRESRKTRTARELCGVRAWNRLFTQSGTTKI